MDVLLFCTGLLLKKDLVELKAALSKKLQLLQS